MELAHRKSRLDQSPSGHWQCTDLLIRRGISLYIAAYMLADFDGEMERSDPIYYLAPRSAHPLVAGTEAPPPYRSAHGGRYACSGFTSSPGAANGGGGISHASIAAATF